MDLRALFLSNTGRISRRTWWIGTLILALASAVLNILLLSLGLPGAARWGVLLVYILICYPALNLGLKRRHDREHAGQDYIVLLAGSVIFTILQTLGIGYTEVDLGNGFVGMSPDTVMSVAQLVFALFGLYMLVQLGFLRGTQGVNSYGPDPLG